MYQRVGCLPCVDAGPAQNWVVQSDHFSNKRKLPLYLRCFSDKGRASRWCSLEGLVPRNIFYVTRSGCWNTLPLKILLESLFPSRTRRNENRLTYAYGCWSCYLPSFDSFVVVNVSHVRSEHVMYALLQHQKYFLAYDWPLQDSIFYR